MEQNIKLRYQLSHKFQVVEVTVETNEQNIKAEAEKALSYAKQELEKAILNEIQMEAKYPSKNNASKPPFNSAKGNYTPNYNKGAQTSQKDPLAKAINRNGYPIKSSDNVELTNGEVSACVKAGKKPWEITKKEIDNLVYPFENIDL